MQCEACSEPGNVRITEVRDGRPVDRHFCKRHAAKQLGLPAPEEWEAFLAWVVSYFKEHGALPAAAEMLKQGEVGAHMAKVYERHPDEVLNQLHKDVQKRLTV